LLWANPPKEDEDLGRRILVKLAKEMLVLGYNLIRICAK
jgi:hypothetical protein